MLHDLNLSVTEVGALLIFLISILSVWISTKVKIAKMETTMNIKIATIENKIAEYIKENSETMSRFIKDNKEEHREIGHDVKNIRHDIQAICVSIARLEP